MTLKFPFKLSFSLAMLMSFVVMAEGYPQGVPLPNATNSTPASVVESSPPPAAEPQLDSEPVAPLREPLQAKAVVVDINSETLNYDKEKDVYVAEGKVHVVISEQNSELIGDRITYDPKTQLLVAEGHVIINKNGQKTAGRYARIDLTRESALINDPITRVDSVRVKAKTALVNPDYTELRNGRLLINTSTALAKFNPKARPKKSTDGKNEKTSPGEKATAQKPGGKLSDKLSSKFGKKSPPKAESPGEQPVAEGDLASLSEGAGMDLEQRRKLYQPEQLDLSSDKGLSEEAFSDTAPGTKTAALSASQFRLKVNTITIRRGDDGYDQIDLKRPFLYWKNHNLGYMPANEFGYDETTGEVDYLGPDIGYDPDYGGFYYGPGWDFQAGKGIVRFSPLVTYGGGGRRSRGASFDSNGVGPGVGGIVHYRSRKNKLDFGYSTRADQPVLLYERKLFDGKTRLQAAVNEDYTNGFLGFERPHLIGQITDFRKLKEFGNFQLDSFASAGVAQDEFFPTNERTFFVDAKEDSDPVTAGRLQLQLRLKNKTPLLRVGEHLSFGFEGQAAMSAYTTGDIVGLLRLGPTMNVNLNRWNSNVRYFSAFAGGDSPFVFDSYYQGRQNLQLVNSFRVSNFLTVGARNDLNLLKDNDKNALMIGNALFAVVGPKEVKFNVAYDFIRKRSYFGINFYPGSGDTKVDYEKLRIFQPQNYMSTGAAP